MSESEGTVRFAIEIDTEMNEQLKMFLPWGVKTEAMRALLKLLIKSQRETSDYIATDLIRGRCKLVVQDLNAPDPVEVIGELTAKIQYLVDNWPAPLEDGCISFPDGDRWDKSKPK